LDIFEINYFYLAIVPLSFGSTGKDEKSKLTKENIIK
jgi:hypothetical protein